MSQDLVAVAMGQKPADLVICNGRWVNVHSGEILPGTDVAIIGGRIAYVGPNAGPCIGPQVFEVGAEVRAAFVASDANAAACFAPHSDGKFMADLPALARQRLAHWGVVQVYGNDSSPPWCTVGNPQRYFSYRRDQPRLGASGRMAACIWRA